MNDAIAWFQSGLGEKGLHVPAAAGTTLRYTPTSPLYICSSFSRPPRPSCFPIFSCSVFLFWLSAGIVTSTSQPLTSAPVSFRCLSAWNVLIESRVWLRDFWAVLLYRYPRRSVPALTDQSETWTRRTSSFCRRLFDLPLIFFFFFFDCDGQLGVKVFRTSRHPSTSETRKSVRANDFFVLCLHIFFFPSRYCPVLSGL